MRIGTRGSDLALWQARFVRALLQKEAGCEAEIVIISTAGDRDHSVSLAAMAGKGFFTKEIEEALYDGRVDVAVHSLKDLQTEMPDGLTLCAMPQRVDRRDVLLIRPDAVDAGQILRLRSGARVGTSANRRIGQLQFLRPDLEVTMLRGNVPTRVNKLRDGQYDAIVAAAAGLDRLELKLDDLHVYRLPSMLFVPAPGQGTLALQTRADDAATNAIIGKLDQPVLRRTVDLEREILRRLEGGCQLALGTAASEIEHGQRLSAFLGTADPAIPRRVVVAGIETGEILTATERYLRGEMIPGSPSGPVRVWITRAPERAKAFQECCDSARFAVEAIPTFVDVAAGSEDAQKKAIAALDTYDWIFLTSQIAVGRFAALIAAHGAVISETTRIAAIGRKTASAITAQGWSVGFVSDVADAHAFGAAFCDIVTGKIGKILFPCAVAATDVLESKLASVCTEFVRLDCYDTVAHPALTETVAQLPQPDAVVYTSPRAAKFLLGHCPGLKSQTAVAIGPATSDALLAAGFTNVYEAPDRSLEGTAEVINGLYTVPSTPPLAPQPADS